MLRKIRITLAVLCFVSVTLLFLDFTGTIHAWFGWLAKIQFLPAVLALNLGVVAALVLLTLLLGRVYCSVVCPLGVMQDVFGRLGRRRRKNRYSHSPALSWLRYTVLSLFVVALAAGVGSVVALLDPYGAYGRIASNLSRRFGSGETTCWPASPKGPAATPSTGRMSGSRACRPLRSLSPRSRRWPFWRGGTVVPTATRFAR